MTKESFQERYNQIQSQMKALKSEIKENGFFLQNGIVQEDRETIGMFWEITHLYDYQGDDIYLCHYSKDAVEIHQEELTFFLTWLKEKNTENTRLFLEKRTELSYDVTDLIEEGILGLEEIRDDAEINIELDSASDAIEVGDIVDGSTFSIRKCKLSDIRLFEQEVINTTYCV